MKKQYTTIELDEPLYGYIPEPSYLMNEQWFEIRKIKKKVPTDEDFSVPFYGPTKERTFVIKGKKHLTIQGVLIVNSYGKVRKVWEDGTVEEIK